MKKMTFIKIFFSILFICFFSAPALNISQAYAANSGFCNNKDETGCHPICEYHPKEVCTFCPMFAAVFNTVSTIGATAINSYSNSVARVVMIAFGIWLAIHILSFASSMETRDVKDLVQSVMIQGFLVMIAVLIIKGGVAGFFSTFLEPVYSTGHKMSQVMFEDCVSQKSGIVKCDAADQKAVSSDFGLIRRVENGLPVTMGNTIIQTMTMMENRILKVKALGSAFLCSSWEEGLILFKLRFFFIGIAMWLAGVVLIIAIPFLIIDSVFQLSVASALLPIAVGSFAFKSTRQYSKKVWETLLNSTFSFLFLSIVVLILLSALEYVTQSGIGNSIGLEVSEFNKMYIDTGSEEGIYAELKEKFSWTFSGFLKLIFVFVLAWSVMNMGKEFAGEFASSISSTSIGSDIGVMAASSAKGMAVKAGKPLAKSIGSGASKAGRSIIKNSVSGVYGGARWVGRKFKFLNAKTTVNGNTTTRTKKNGETLSVTENNGVTRTIQKNKNGEEQLTLKNENITVERTKKLKSVNGQLQYVYNEEVKFKGQSLKDAVRPNGEVDAAALNSLLGGATGEDREILQNAVVNGVIEERFGKAAYDSARADNIAPPEIIKSSSGDLVIKEQNAKGETIFKQMKLHPNGALETSITKIDAKGNVTQMTSDGIRNRLVKTKLQDGVDAKNISSLDDLNSNTDKSQTKTAYGYTEYYRKAVQRGARHENIPLGMMAYSETHEEKKWWRKEADTINEAAIASNFIQSSGNEFLKSEVSFYFK